MAIIELQDPLSTEIQSTTVSGAVDALNVISKGLDLGSELLEKVQMYPVEGLESSDPRRIYQVENGNRLWLSSPNQPVIYVNDSKISQSENEFSIDYIGGSITFSGDYRPGAEDVVTVSCAHISSQSKVYGGSEIKITFTPGFLGQQFTVTGGENESYSGVVDSSLKSVVRVKGVNTTYTVSANSIGGKNFTAEVEIGAYYGQYEVTLSSFNATIEVTTEPSASVSIKGPTTSYNVVANQSGKAVITVKESGNYSATATYKNVNSNTATVNVTSEDNTYTTTLSFITLSITVDVESTIKVQNGSTTFTEVASIGTVKFWLPNTGTWKIIATDGEFSTERNVECTEYRDYSIELRYKLESASWDQIHQMSSSGKAASYYEVGDTKEIVLNGTVGNVALDNLTISVFILGFNHNSELEGNNTIHFAIGKINGKMVAFCHSYYGSITPTVGAFIMNKDPDNTGGWASCEMRNETLGNSGTPNYPPSMSLLASLPNNLRNVMRSVTKYTDNFGGESGDSSSFVTSTSDYVFLLSSYEVYGSTGVANSYEEYKQQQYAYFKSGNSKVAYNHTELGEAVNWWLRSPSASSDSSFCGTSSDGYSSTIYAAQSSGVLAAFSV